MNKQKKDGKSSIDKSIIIAGALAVAASYGIKYFDAPAAKAPVEAVKIADPYPFTSCMRLLEDAKAIKERWPNNGMARDYALHYIKAVDMKVKDKMCSEAKVNAEEKALSLLKR